MKTGETAISLEEIKVRLRESAFIQYDEGENLRSLLKKIADEIYVQRYNDTEQLDFINRHEATFQIIHPQTTGCPFYLKMFTVCTQHVYGDNVRQILDIALDMEKSQLNKI